MIMVQKYKNLFLYLYSLKKIKKGLNFLNSAPLLLQND